MAVADEMMCAALTRFVVLRSPRRSSFCSLLCRCLCSSAESLSSCQRRHCQQLPPANEISTNSNVQIYYYYFHYLRLGTLEVSSSTAPINFSYTFFFSLSFISGTGAFARGMLFSKLEKRRAKKQNHANV